MKKVFSVILAIFVVSGSIGAPFSVHHCYSIDTTEISFQVEDHCCSSDIKNFVPVSTQSECCDFFATYLQVDFEAFSSAATLNFAPPVDFASVLTFNPFSSFDQKITYTDSYPHIPKYNGRDILLMGQTFLI